jgi:O-antigen ligase
VIRSVPSSAARPDLAARLLEFGLAAGLIVAPFPFGAVRATGRLALELGALGLLVLWIARSAFRPTPLPSRLVRVGLAGLLALAVIQTLPLGDGLVRLVSPGAVAIRADSRPPPAAQESERRLLGTDPARLDAPATLSLDPGATASALRTGAAICAALLVATTVSATCGARRIALALLIGAAFQGLYGLLVMASGHDRIWLTQKKYFLDIATGTFVNPNHFACLLAMSLPCGLALVYDNARRGRRAAAAGRLAAWLSADGSRNWLLGLLLIVGTAGLLLSYSRAGIAFGLLALALTMLGAGRHQGLRVRLIVAVLVAAAALTPLLQIGAERLIDDYAGSPSELHGARVRVWLDSFALVGSYPLTGCGFGAFAASYPLVRSPEIRNFFAHAHNDPLQLVAEGGLVGSAFLLLILIPLLARAVRAIGGAKGTIAVGFACGFVAVCLHGLVDFNFHIPSNAVTAAALAGTLLGLPWKRAS